MKHILTITLLLCSLTLLSQADKQPRYDTVYFCKGIYEVREYERQTIWDNKEHWHWSELMPCHVCFLERKEVKMVIWKRL